MAHTLQAKLAEWIQYRTQFLNELLRLEAPPSITPFCVGCQEPAAYRCQGCHSSEMMCQECLISSHAETPFHPVQVRLLVCYHTTDAEGYSEVEWDIF